MSKNYDMIATVDIDIASPLADDTSFDNLLVMGPAPKQGGNAPAVGVYSDLSEVESAGFITSGDDADPVGVAASVAFAQSPRPTALYIAVQKLSEGAVVAAETIEKVTAAADQYIGKKDGLTGCTVAFNADLRSLNMNLTGPVNKVKNTGVFDTMKALREDGCTVTLDGQEITDAKSFLATEVGKKLVEMQQGDEEIIFYVKLNQAGGNEVSYKVRVAYPAEGETSTQAVDDEVPVDQPDQELEATTATIARALAKSGWYVLCTAGVDPALYEEIAAYMETQEKMFCYTEMDCIRTVDGEPVVTPAVGKVYFRTMGIYGRESVEQAEDEIPAANRYMNVAWVAKWLNYESGSETSSFKQLSSVYPSDMTSGEMKALKDKNLNFFIAVGNRNITMNGKTMAGEWADVIRFRDWLKNDMQVRVVNLFVTNPKIPFTDSGIALVQNQMLASLKAGQDVGGIAASEFDVNGDEIPGYQTSVPMAASIPADEKAERTLKRCKFKARLAGAIHFAELKGSLTYEM